MSLKETRVDYTKGELLDSLKEVSPIEIMTQWLELAKSEIDQDFNVMTLSSVRSDGYPSSRIVLLREFSSEGLVFFTNYQSDKGAEMEKNPKVNLNFFWKELEKQIRVKGIVSKLSAEKSDEYFNSRPRKSQIGAWVSDQSSVVASRHKLMQREEELTKEYEGKEVPRPEHWGGYIVKPVSFEFWQGRSGRLHDRLLFKNENGKWVSERLCP